MLTISSATMLASLARPADAGRLFRLTARSALHVLFPTPCTTCSRRLRGDSIPFICDQCWHSIRPLEGPSCPRCARPFSSPHALIHSPTHLCEDCRRRKPAFTRTWSLYPYASPLREAITLFKYQKRYALAGALGDLLIKALPPELEVDLIMPVPLHPVRLRTREFNQSLLLAEALSRRLETPLSYTNLIRVRDNVAQTSLPRSARLANLRRAFALRMPQALRTRRVLIVDDVYTTGTTLNECAKVLRRAGASDVYGLTLARTVDQAVQSARLVQPARDTALNEGM